MKIIKIKSFTLYNHMIPELPEVKYEQKVAGVVSLLPHMSPEGEFTRATIAFASTAEDIKNMEWITSINFFIPVTDKEEDAVAAFKKAIKAQTLEGIKEVVL